MEDVNPILTWWVICPISSVRFDSAGCVVILALRLFASGFERVFRSSVPSLITSIISSRRPNKSRLRNCARASTVHNMIEYKPPFKLHGLGCLLFSRRVKYAVLSQKCYKF